LPAVKKHKNRPLLYGYYIMEQKIFEKLSNIIPVPTAHDEGLKYVFLKNEDTPTKLTQFAYGEFKPGEKCEMHLHKTMEECFYFLSGEGEYSINGNTYKLEAGVFLRIPAQAPHELRALGDEPLKFVYFGIATE